jgi:hypothetical protein
VRNAIFISLFAILIGLLPINRTHAANSSHTFFVKVKDLYNNVSYLDASKTVSIKHDMNEFNVRTMNPSAPGNDLSYLGQITLKDADGNAIPFKIIPINSKGEAQSDWTLTLSPGAYLKSNETYTLTFDGWKDSNGNILPTTTYTFIPDSSPIHKSYTLNYKEQDIFGVDIFHLYKAHYPPHAEVYHFSVSSGALNFAVWAALGAKSEDDEEEITLETADSTPTVLYHKTVKGSDPTNQQIQIPLSGEYNLMIKTNFVHPYQLLMDGPDLDLSNEIPDFYFPQFNFYETHNTSLDLNIGIYGSSLDFFIDGKFVKTIKPDAAGVLNKNDLAVDTSKLTDGAHLVTYIVHGKQSENEQISYIPFLVDRVDSFSDVPKNYWGHHDIDVMHDLGIINGRTKKIFDPEAVITRAEFAVLLAKTLHLKAPLNSTNSFPDVPQNAWYKPYVDALKQSGYIKGVSIGNQLHFKPNQVISRAEAATIISRTSRDLQGQNYTDQIKDFNRVPDYAKEAIATLYLQGWLSGFPDGTIRANNSLTRAESATILSHYLKM